MWSTFFILIFTNVVFAKTKNVLEIYQFKASLETSTYLFVLYIEYASDLSVSIVVHTCLKSKKTEKSLIYF